MQKHSWLYADLAKIKTLEQIPIFPLIRTAHLILLTLHLLLINLHQTISHFWPEVELGVKMMPQTQESLLKWGAVIGFVHSFILIGALGFIIETKKFKKIPQYLQKNWFITHLPFAVYIISALRAPRLLPKKFGVVFATLLGAAGIILGSFWLVIDPTVNDPASVLFIISITSTVSYAMMRTAVITTNRYSLIHAGLLYLSVSQLPALLLTLQILSATKLALIQPYLVLGFFLLYPLFLKLLNSLKTS